MKRFWTVLLVVAVVFTGWAGYHWNDNQSVLEYMKESGSDYIDHLTEKGGMRPVLGRAKLSFKEASATPWTVTLEKVAIDFDGPGAPAIAADRLVFSDLDWAPVVAGPRHISVVFEGVTLSSTKGPAWQIKAAALSLAHIDVPDPGDNRITLEEIALSEMLATMQGGTEIRGRSFSMSGVTYANGRMLTVREGQGSGFHVANDKLPLPASASLQGMQFQGMSHDLLMEMDPDAYDAEGKKYWQSRELAGFQCQGLDMVLGKGNDEYTLTCRTMDGTSKLQGAVVESSLQARNITLRTNGDTLAELDKGLGKVGVDELSLNLFFEVAIDYEKGIIDIGRYCFNFPGLGDLTLEARLHGVNMNPKDIEADPLGMWQGAAIAGGRMEMTDRKMIDLVLHLTAPYAGSTAKALKGQGMLGLMAAGLATDSKPLRSLCVATSRLLGKPGTLTITLKPHHPLPLKDLDSLEPNAMVDALGLESSYTPLSEEGGM